MANANQVIINGETILDLRSDTVTPETLQKGYTAHDKSGTKITGTLEAGGGKEEEAVTVALDMASGDQIITPSEGKTLSQVTVTKPDDLLPSRVVLGSNIGGVDGNYFAPEIWVLNEEIVVPAQTLTFTGLFFLSYATKDIEQTIIQVVPQAGKVAISVRDAAGNDTYIKRFTATSSNNYTDTNGWYGNPAYPQRGRILVFFHSTERGRVHTWLQQNAVLYGGSSVTAQKGKLFKLGDTNRLKSLSVTANGTYYIKPNAPYSTFERATVNVNVPVPSVQDTKSLTITSNGTVSVTPDAPYDALKKVDVTVDVASGGGGAGFKVTFPATAMNWNRVDAGGIVQADGTVVALADYSTLAGKTIPNVLEICVWGRGYYVPRMTVQTGKIMLTHLSTMGVMTSIAVDGESSITYTGNGAQDRWIPLADTIISAIEMYNTD